VGGFSAIINVNLPFQTQCLLTHAPQTTKSIPKNRISLDAAGPLATCSAEMSFFSVSATLAETPLELLSCWVGTCQHSDRSLILLVASGWFWFCFVVVFVQALHVCSSTVTVRGTVVARGTIRCLMGTKQKHFQLQAGGKREQQRCWSVSSTIPQC
jgi:hypothetical protein